MNRRIAAWIMTGMLAAGAAQAGPKWEISEDSWMQLSLLGQLQATYDKDADPATDAFLRRGRIILSGQIMDGVQIFAETDYVNAGRNGFPDAEMKIQDAFADIRLGQTDHWVKAGLILLPFSFESRASASSLLGLDYNAETIKLPNTFVWRDYGAELHGAFGPKLSYIIGVFDGYDESGGIKNDDAGARVTGHLAFNVIGEAETGWFFTQERLGAKGDYLSLGAGGDMQSKATRSPGAEGPDGVPGPGVVQDHEAWVVDLQSGWSLAEKLGLTVNAAWYDYDNALFTGQTAFVETGLRYDRWMGLVKGSLQDPDEGEDRNDLTLGFDYFHRNHNLRMGVEYRFGDSADLWLARLQFLL